MSRRPVLKAPAIQLTVRPGETIDDILTAAFVMTPYSPEKAMELETLLTAPDIEYPQKEELRNLLISIWEPEDPQRSHRRSTNRRHAQSSCNSSLLVTGECSESRSRPICQYSRYFPNSCCDATL